MKDKNLDIITYAVSLIIKAVIIAGRFSGRARKRSLKRLAAMDADTKDKELFFLRDKVYQLDMQVSILQKRIKKQQKKPRYTIRERLFILWHMVRLSSANGTALSPQNGALCPYEGFVDETGNDLCQRIALL